MAHFAQLNSDNTVINVIHINTMEIVDMEIGDEVEEIGISKLKSLYGDDTKWIQTSYSGSIREKFAGIGYTYNEELDCFVTPRPFQSWTFDINTKDWQPPVPKPEDVVDEDGTTHSYSWNESKYALDPNEAWELLG